MRRQTISFVVSMLVLALSTSVIVVSPATGQDKGIIIDKLNQLYGKLEGEKPALLHKVNAVIHQIEAGAFNGAINKLENDVKKSIIAWVENPDELIQLIDEIIDLIKGIVPPPPHTPDFEITSSIDRLDVVQDGVNTTKITITSIRNFNRQVNLSATTTATGINVILDPESVTPTADGSANSTLIVEADHDAVSGEYEITIKGVSGSLEHDVTIPLKIIERTPHPPKDFALAASPATLTIQKGKANTSIVTVTSINGFEEQVNLTVASAQITGVSITLNPNKVIPPPGAYAISVLVVDVSDTATVDTRTIAINAASSSIQHNVSITLTITEPPVPPKSDFSINAYPASLTIEQADSHPVTIILASLKGFTGSVTLTISSESIPNVTLSLDPVQISLSSNGFATSTLTLNVGIEAVPSEHELTITGTSGSLQHNVTVTMEIVLEKKPPKIISIIRLPKEAPAYNETVSIQASVVDLESGLRDVILSASAGATQQNLTMTLNNGLYIAIISAFPFNVSVQYRIYASDNVGNWATSMLHSYIVADPYPPVIESLTWQPETPVTGETIILNATVREPPEASGVKMVVLWYKNTTTDDWNRVPMTQALNTANWTAAISNQSDTKVEFYIEAIDKVDNRNQSTTETFDVLTSAFPLALILAAIVILAGATGGGAYYARRRRKKPATGTSVPPAAVEPVPPTR